MAGEVGVWRCSWLGRMDPCQTKLSLHYNQPNLVSGGRCPSPEVTYPYPLYKDPVMEKLKLAHFKQNQV